MALWSVVEVSKLAYAQGVELHYADLSQRVFFLLMSLGPLYGIYYLWSCRRSRSCSSWGRRRFEHIPQIQESLRMLFSGLRAGCVSRYASLFNPAELNAAFETGHTIGIQNIAKAIAQHFGLKITTVVVAIRDSLPAPGQVELFGDRSAFFLELRPDVVFDPDSLLAVLTHEISHVFLHCNGIKAKDGGQDEILPDTCAMFLGFGSLVSTQYRLRTRQQMVRLQRQDTISAT